VGGDSSESDGDADAVRRLCDKCLYLLLDDTMLML
jgi:hypothetical protein